MIPVGAGLRTRVAFPRQQSCTRMHTISHPSISYTLYRWFTPGVFAASAWTLPFQVGLLSHALVRFALPQLAEACICSCVWMDVDAVVAATTAGQDAATPPSTHALRKKGLHFPCMRRPLPPLVSLLPSPACFHTAGPIGPPPPPRFEPELPSLLIGRFASFRLGVSPLSNRTNACVAWTTTTHVAAASTRRVSHLLRARGKEDEPKDRASWEGTMRAARCIADAKVCDPRRRRRTDP